MNQFLLLSLILFTLGLWGVLRSASLLKIFMSIEVMLASINLFVLSLFDGTEASLSAVAASFAEVATKAESAKAGVFIMFVWLISVAEISIVLALFILMYRRLKTMDVNTLKKLKW